MTTADAIAAHYHLIVYMNNQILDSSKKSHFNFNKGSISPSSVGVIAPEERR